ncbi:MAG: TonB-dependent receptor plug domain-containing protein, partial [Rhizorhabdus sp.]
MRGTKLYHCLFAGSATVALTLAGTPTALAQVADPIRAPDSAPAVDPIDEPAVEEATATQDDGQAIVVTGTFLRGIAPTGTNVVAMSSEDIAISGAVNSNQILAKIPQVSSAFNQVPTLPTNDPGLSVIFPNIRNIPAGGATTLVLLDGHRVGGSGGFASVDPDIFPPAIIEKIDVIPDGGSSIYGSDAVGGVINFITRRRFDGLETSARYGFGDDYHTLDLAATAGKDWGSGSGYLSYSYAETGELQGKDRDYFDHFAPDIGQCAPGTVAITRGDVVTTYALPDRVPGTANNCNNVAEFTIFPRLERHSLFGSLNQQLSDAIEFNA